VPLAVSTQYTNVTDTQPDTTRQQEPRYAPSLGSSRAAKTVPLHYSFILAGLTLWTPKAIIVSHRMNTKFCTLAVDGWAVTFGAARRGLGGLRPRPVPSSLYQM